MDVILPLRGRERERAVADLLAMAQVHRPPEERAGRGVAIAAAYESSSRRALWGLERDGVLLAIAGVELRGAALWLSELAVVPEARTTGIGRGLIGFLRQTYPGVPIEGNTISESKGFYTSCGFTIREAGALPSGEPVLRFTLPATRVVP